MSVQDILAEITKVAERRAELEDQLDRELAKPQPGEE